MTKEEIIIAINRYLTEIWNEGNIQSIEELISTPDFNFILPFASFHTREDFIKLVILNRTVFENLTYYIDNPEEDLIIDDYKGACYWRMTGKHVGVWRNVPPSNKEVTIEGISFFKFNKEGKIMEIRLHNDTTSLFKQIGGLKMLY